MPGVPRGPCVPARLGKFLFAHRRCCAFIVIRQGYYPGNQSRQPHMQARPRPRARFVICHAG